MIRCRVSSEMALANFTFVFTGVFTGVFMEGTITDI